MKNPEDDEHWKVRETPPDSNLFMYSSVGPIPLLGRLGGTRKPTAIIVSYVRITASMPKFKPRCNRPAGGGPSKYQNFGKTYRSSSTHFRQLPRRDSRLISMSQQWWKFMHGLICLGHPKTLCKWSRAPATCRTAAACRPLVPDGNVAEAVVVLPVRITVETLEDCPATPLERH